MEGHAVRSVCQQEEREAREGNGTGQTAFSMIVPAKRTSWENPFPKILMGLPVSNSLTIACVFPR